MMQDGKNVFQAMFKDDSLTAGGQLKAKGEVLKEFFKSRSKPPNMNCRVESFARICQTFDCRRRRWVTEMGFGGLLYLSGDMHLPRQIGYWLVTRMDPISKMLLTPDGRCFRLSKNQVHWVLGIPNGPKVLPSSTKTLKRAQREKVENILAKYGKKRNNGQPKVYDKVGIEVYPELLERLERYWDEKDEEEFKTLFLLIALEMLLCPTLATRLSSDLVPALTCAMEAVEYDWCTLVLSKLLTSVRSFARRFYSFGHAGGCGGCILFVLIFYLDRLDREALQWGVFPRLKVWTMKEILIATKEDRVPNGGDYGFKGTLDVAYGEIHPRQARDTDGPGVVSKVDIEHDIEFLAAPRRRRGSTSSRTPRPEAENADVGESAIVVAAESDEPNKSHGKISVGPDSVPHVGHLADWSRFLPTGAVSLLRKMIAVVMRASNYLMIGDWPLILSSAFVISFHGQSDYNTVMLPSLTTFIGNPRCCVLMVVSEVSAEECGTTIGSDLPMYRICVAIKRNSRSEMMLLSADSVTSDMCSISRPMLNLQQVYHDIFVSCMKGLTTSTLSKNMLLVQRSRV